MRFSLIGTRGVPARYGGFETCIEEVGSRLAMWGHDVTVYCRTADPAQRIPTYRGMNLIHLPALRKRSLETLSHTAASVAHLTTHRAPDAAIVFNAANAPLLPAIKARGIPVATHVDGLEWKRTKWGPTGQQYYRRAEAMAVRFSDALIADAVGIADYYRGRFGTDTRLIRYGAPVVTRTEHPGLAEMGLTADGYHLVVARFEPENNVHLIVDGYLRSQATQPLVVVGSAPYGDAYISAVHELAAGDPRVRFLGGVWDQDLLDQLYANATVYWHGHTVGGTNPSLLRAIGAGAPAIAHDNVFNREVLGTAGRFFLTPEDVATLVEAAEAAPEANTAYRSASRHQATLYDWDDVARSYESLLVDLAALTRRGARVPATMTPTPPSLPTARAPLADSVSTDDVTKAA